MTKYGVVMFKVRKGTATNCAGNSIDATEIKREGVDECSRFPHLIESSEGRDVWSGLDRRS
jgi:hypothetical protein